MDEQIAPCPWVVNEVKYPEVMWARYAGALGYDKMVSWFGENWPPLECRPLEQVFAVRDMTKASKAFDPEGHPDAWLSLSVNQFVGPEQIHMSRGVWPGEHGRGLGRFLRQWAEDYCRDKGGKTLVIWVNASNEQHLDKVKADPYWYMTGLNFDPLAFEFAHEIN